SDGAKRYGSLATGFALGTPKLDYPSQRESRQIFQKNLCMIPFYQNNLDTLHIGFFVHYMCQKCDTNLLQKMIEKIAMCYLKLVKCIDFTTVQDLRAQVKELQSENEHLKSKVIDFITCQTLQVQVTKLKSENEDMNLSVEKLNKAREIVEATLRGRDEMVFAHCEKIRLLEEQSEPFYEIIKMIEKENESNVSKISIKSSTPENENLELVKEMGDTVKCFDEEKKVFESKILKLEKVLTQRVKDFDDVKTELSRRTGKFEAYFANFKKENDLLKS
nr:hypothetical protein [Tanacetum cinerariifolium]